MTRVPAKINLWLEVIRKREDGYHDISSLMLPSRFTITCALGVRPGERADFHRCDSPEIPSDERNLAWRAADLYLKESGIKAGIDIDLEKHIPWRRRPRGRKFGRRRRTLRPELIFPKCRCAGRPGKSWRVSLGADVPFFLTLPAGAGDRDRRKAAICGMAPDYPLLLIKPPVSVPTGWVYQSLKLTKGTASN